MRMSGSALPVLRSGSAGRCYFAVIGRHSVSATTKSASRKRAGCRMRIAAGWQKLLSRRSFSHSSARYLGSPAFKPTVDWDLTPIHLRHTSLSALLPR
jgi:hypothetical protein